MFLRRLLPISIALSLILTACGDIAGPSEVKIAVSLPLGLEIGKDIQNAVQLALDEANGRAGDVAVDLLILNTSDPDGNPVSPDMELNAAQKAVDDPGVVAYLGGLTSDQSRVAIPVLNKASVTLISPSATWPGLTKPGYGPGEPGIYYPTGLRNFFRVVPSDEVQGSAAARWANQLGINEVHIVAEDTAYGRGIAGIFEIEAKDLGMNIMAYDDFNSDSTTDEELEALVARVVETQPELLYFGGAFAPKGGAFVSTARKLDNDLEIMGPDGLVQDQLITEFGADLVENIYGTNVAIPISQLESATEFLESYKEAYGKEPPPYAGGAYESMNILLHAIEQAQEPTREDVLKAMKNLGEYSGILGDWRFDESGDISLTSISGMQIRDGEWAFVKIIE